MCPVGPPRVRAVYDPPTRTLSTTACWYSYVDRLSACLGLRGWSNILVDSEEIGRIVFLLDRS